VEKLIEEQFGIFLYNNGKGKTITKTDYFKWYCRSNTRVRTSFDQKNYK
jgi:hypothetical protein